MRPACERPCGPSQRAFLGLVACDSQRLAVLQRPLGGAKRPGILLWGQSLAPKGPASWSGIAKQAHNASSAPVLLARLLSSWCPGTMVELDCPARSGPRGGCSMTTASWPSHACNELWVWTTRHVRSCCGACVYTAVSRSASRKQLPGAYAARRSPWKPLGTFSVLLVKIWGQSMLLLTAAWVREVALSNSAARLAHSGGSESWICP